MEPDNLVLQPRDVQFDWPTLPMHWVPDEPVATHVMNVLHLLLPEGVRICVDRPTGDRLLLEEL